MARETYPMESVGCESVLLQRSTDLPAGLKFERKPVLDS